MIAHAKTPRAYRSLAPYTQFAGVSFEAGTLGRERLTTWEPHPVLRARKVAGASIVKRQHMRYAADTLTLTILLSTERAYIDLLATLGTTGELRLPAEMVVVAPGDTLWHQFGKDYVVYQDVTLADISKIQQTREWWVLAEVTFERDHPEAA